MKRWLGSAALAIAAVAMVVLMSIGDRKRTLDSRILEESRPLLVHLPKGYRESTRSYPVLYVLDGNDRPSAFDAAFKTIARQLDSMSLEGIPLLILIGVVNTHRSRDMLPVTTGLYRESGGAASFLASLTEEIIPYVDENFRTTGERILYGPSDAGLFTLYAFLERPDVFSGYITSSPTVGHCPSLLSLKARQLLREHSVVDKTLFIIYGDDDISYAKDFIPALARTIRHQDTRGLRFGMNIVPGGGHVPKSSLYDGLRFYFSPK